MLCSKKLSSISAILLLQGLFCRPMQKAQSLLSKLKTGSNANYELMQDSYHGLSGIPLDPKKRAWDSMIKSVDHLKKDYGRVNAEEFQDEYKDVIEVIEKTIQQLSDLHKRMEKMFGKPGMEIGSSLDKPQELEGYQESILEMLDNLMSFLRYPKPIHHLLVFGKNSILETINYICRYKLAKPDILEKVQGRFSSKRGLLWMAHTIACISRTGNKLWTQHLEFPLEEDQLKHYLHMDPIYNVYKNLKKNQQDFLLFALLVEEHGIQKGDNFWKDKPITKPLHKPVFEQLPLLRKIRKRVERQLENEELDEAARDKFFLEVKDDLMKIMQFYFTPGYSYDEYSKEEFSLLFKYRASTLQFINERIGVNYMSKFERELKGYKEGAASFAVRYQFHNLLKNSVQWKNSFSHFIHHASKFMKKGQDHEAPPHVLEEIGTTYLTKIRENYQAQEQLMTELGSPRLEELLKMESYRCLTNIHKQVINSLPEMEDGLKFLLSDSKGKW